MQQIVWSHSETSQTDLTAFLRANMAADVQVKHAAHITANIKGGVSADKNPLIEILVAHTTRKKSRKHHDKNKWNYHLLFMQL